MLADSSTTYRQADGTERYALTDELVPKVDVSIADDQDVPMQAPEDVSSADDKDDLMEAPENDALQARVKELEAEHRVVVG